MDILRNEIDGHLNQLLNNEEISEVLELNKVIKSKCKTNDYCKYELNSKSLPMYFTGDLKSEIVFVELNPGQGLLNTEVTSNGIEMKMFNLEKKISIKSFDDYIDFYKNFGKYKIEHQINNKQKIRSFDLKQLYFFKGVGLFNLGNNSSFDYDDMLKVRENKLQLEIVPYMSKEFNFSNFKDEYIESRIRNILDLIQLYDRKYVFVTGSQSMIRKAFGEINFIKYEILGKALYIGIKVINNMKVCFIPSYKSRYILSTKELQFEYGKLAKSILAS